MSYFCGLEQQLYSALWLLEVSKATIRQQHDLSLTIEEHLCLFRNRFTQQDLVLWLTRTICALLLLFWLCFNQLKMLSYYLGPFRLLSLSTNAVEKLGGRPEVGCEFPVIWLKFG